MEKYKFDENNGLWYELQGDYYLPCLKTTGGRTGAYRDMGAADGVTEQLKADNPMEWINKMNNIRNRGSEIVNTKIIFKQAAAAIDFTNIRFHLTIFKRYGCNICNEDSKSK